MRKYGRLVNFDEKHKLYNIKPILLATGISPKRLPQSVSYNCPILLDQGSEGSCVGNGWTYVLACTPQPIQMSGTQKEPLQIYYDGQRVDPWEGGAYAGATPFYEGTTVSAGGKSCMANGYIGGFCWSFTFEDFLIGVSHFSPAAIGIKWLSDMEDVDANGFIHYSGSERGGHCVCVDELSILDPYNINYDTDWAGGPNSWGNNFGLNGNGRWKMTLGDLRKALADQGEACFPLAKRQEPLVRPW